MANKKMMQISSDDYMDIIEGALSGLTGGTLLGSAFGFTGGLIGGVLGSFITGYDAYKTTRKNHRASGAGKMLQDH